MGRIEDEDHDVSIVPKDPRKQALAEESSLRLRRVANSFEINKQAKESIASSQLGQFFEVLCVKLRHRVTELDVQTRGVETSQTQNAPQQQPTTLSLTSLLSPNSVFGGQTGLATLSMIALGQGGWIFQNIGSLKAIVALFLVVSAKQRVENFLHTRLITDGKNVVSQFSTTKRVGDELQTERSIREVARAICMRHVDQIVPLTKMSQNILSDVIVNRVIKHLKRGRHGYPEESRSPIISKYQRLVWETKSFYHGIFTPRDRIPTKNPLNLVERCMRALTAESNEGDEVQLELESWYSRDSELQNVWTASGILNRSGLRCVIDGKEYEFVHEYTDSGTYGFAYADIKEARERRMIQIRQREEDENKTKSKPVSRL